MFGKWCARSSNIGWMGYGTLFFSPQNWWFSAFQVSLLKKKTENPRNRSKARWHAARLGFCLIGKKTSHYSNLAKQWKCEIYIYPNDHPDLVHETHHCWINSQLLAKKLSPFWMVKSSICVTYKPILDGSIPMLVASQQPHLVTSLQPNLPSSTPHLIHESIQIFDLGTRTLNISPQIFRLIVFNTKKLEDHMGVWSFFSEA
jgi:hypothetical protein